MADDIAFERHFTEGELAKLWHVHRTTVHRRLEDQPGIIEFVSQTPGKKKRVSRRVPESVAVRVHRDLQKK
jgi:hypothetical protein